MSLAIGLIFLFGVGVMLDRFAAVELR